MKTPSNTKTKGKFFKLSESALNEKSEKKGMKNRNIIMTVCDLKNVWQHLS